MARNAVSIGAVEPANQSSLCQISLHIVSTVAFWRINMRPSILFERNRQDIRRIASRFPVANPRVFGSVLHGDDAEGSDLDLLVDALPGTTLFDLGGLQVELEDFLGVPVDVLTPGDLPLKFRGQVLAEALAV